MNDYSRILHTARHPFEILLILVLVIIAPAQTSAGGASTYDFLRNDVSARAAGLGGSFTTMTGDVNTMFANPAGLASLPDRTVSFGFFKHLLDINAGYASFGTEVRNLGHIGAGVLYMHYGEFKRTGEEGQDLGTFSAGELAIHATFSEKFTDRLTYGVSAKFIYSSIADVHSSGAALDAGVQYVAVPGRLILGGSLLNLGTQFDPYVTTREPLPLDLKFGIAVFPEHLPVALLFDLHKLNEERDSFVERFKAFSLGAEFSPSPNLQLRVGYNNERRRELKIGSSSGLAGFSFGAGILTDVYTIDYALNSYGSIGSLHRVSVSVEF